MRFGRTVVSGFRQSAQMLMQQPKRDRANTPCEDISTQRAPDDIPFKHQQKKTQRLSISCHRRFQLRREERTEMGDIVAVRQRRRDEDVPLAVLGESDARDRGISISKGTSKSKCLDRVRVRTLLRPSARPRAGGPLQT